MTASLLREHGDDDEILVETNDSPGCRLRGARQMRRLSVEQAAAQLHLSTQIVLALERDDYSAVQGQVFVIGYLRNYARLVMLDPEPLLATYRASLPETASSLAAPVRRALPRLSARPREHASPGPRLLGLLLVAGVAGLGWYGWENREAWMPVLHPASGPAQDLADTGDAFPAAPEHEAGDLAEDGMAETFSPPPEATAPLELDAAPAGPVEPPQTARPVAARPIPAPLSREGAGALSEPGSIPAGGRESASSPVTASAASGGAPEASTAPEPATAAGVEIAFSGPCWVDIYDQERQYKLSGEMRQGDRYVLQGTPPYSLILGNAAAVTITVGGKPFDLQPLTRGNVARFTLDPEAQP